MSDLESLLEAWKTVDNPGQKNLHIAADIVAAAEKIINDRQETSMSKSFWFNFLDITKKTGFL